MPTPQAGEMHDDFIERCIPMVMEEGTVENNEQAVAICNSMWENRGRQKERGIKMNYLRAFRQGTEPGEEGTPIRFTASTEGIKRDGKELKAENWRLDNYKSNPVVLWVHDYMGQNLPIGRADASIDGKMLVADITFDQQDEFARQVESKYRRGFLSAVSVGWNDVSEGKHTFHDLMDISAVPVPADPQALKVHQMRALRDLVQFLNEDTPDVDLSNVDVWDGVATAMVALYRPDSAIEDEVRHGLYITLERAYRKLNKTAPEFMTSEEIATLGDTELRGLFLNDELIRAGAVLSTRNRSDLEQAQALIQRVLDSAKKEEKSPRSRQMSDGEMSQIQKMKQMAKSLMDMMDEMMDDGGDENDTERAAIYTLHELFTKGL